MENLIFTYEARVNTALVSWLGWHLVKLVVTYYFVMHVWPRALRVIRCFRIVAAVLPPPPGEEDEVPPPPAPLTPPGPPYPTVGHGAYGPPPVPPPPMDPKKTA